ncbi:hypothetical protein [Owenweeksia hongkongensis]|uniref:hypothetical protein n=1 Tax=Owenweeksia hongkongensis TaxID=253245 RepID=UPI003A8E23DE
MKGNRKYLSEHSVNLYSNRWLMFPAHQISTAHTDDPEIQEVINNSHIYLICKRPSCFFVPESLSFDGQAISATLAYRINGAIVERPFKMPFNPPEGMETLRISDYPHRDINTYDRNGQELVHVPATVVATDPPVVSDATLHNLEVLYVGQSFGDGTRNSLERLKSHSTLQKILADMQHSYPDDEALLLTFEYCPYRVVSSFDGVDKNIQEKDGDAERFASILDNPLSKKQQISLAEAGLIRYFQPLYNEVYKESFPASDQKVLNQCYTLDFSGLIVEINTDELGLQLWSPTVKSNDHHIGMFNLYKVDERRSFFSFIKGDGSTFEFPDVTQPTK